jgi:hypothetical protein
MLHVSAAQGHLQATHFLNSLRNCAIGQIVHLKHVVVVISNFDDIGHFPPTYLLYCGRSYPIGCAALCLCAFSVALCSL